MAIAGYAGILLRKDKNLVVGTGLEPATPTMSRWCSTN